jgi:glycosyltransferase involved in cell wall biosynthesis
LAIPGDLDSLVAQLARLISDPPLRHALATAAVEKVRADFDIQRNVRALATIFDGFPPSP